MKETKNTIFERVSSLMGFVQPQRSASHQLKASQKYSNFEAASNLCFILENAARSLRTLPEEVAMDPLSSLEKMNTFKYAVEIKTLLPRFERWAKGQCTAAELVSNLHESCKADIMNGYTANHNRTSPIHNMTSVITYQVYCDINKTIERTEQELKERPEFEKD